MSAPILKAPAVARWSNHRGGRSSQFGKVRTAGGGDLCFA